jgi:hypothetical protein
MPPLAGIRVSRLTSARRRLPTTARVPCSGVGRQHCTACVGPGGRRPRQDGTMIWTKRSSACHRYLTGLMTALCLTLGATASAEVQIAGSPAAVSVTTSMDSISDVLAAFSASFNIKYRAEVPLDARARRTYVGSLEDVISRLLDGYSYVVKTTEGSMEIIVLERRGEIVAAPPTPALGKPILSRWR